MINNDILADAQQEIYKRLCSNKLLVSTYSKSGIMRRIKKNIKAIAFENESISFNNPLFVTLQNNAKLLG